ncbi:histidine kinase N-terminal 7TM domain-containing diguanylate cyclase [Niallia endozanthoxylica]|uniref:Diguanylate cyclase n=1 Tax=Niallia endozanthoxylica TaxID=2036016 RepID=A0A5J5I6G2_9BACI|nr:histidine kinase N-terminal 7TM domain-containing protein [Niallia endozanthoxylica]KAA9032382.1 diguanylate cyclase [Niallia endozanthoxylica]
MLDELFVYILAVSIASILSFLLFLYAQFRLKDAPGAHPYMLATLFSAVFTFSYALELSSTSLERMIFWLNIEYLVLPFIPVFIFLMCLEYTGLKLKQRKRLLLFIVPIITIFIHGTNELHRLYYTSIQLNNDGPFPTLKLEHGPWFYVHSLFLFMCLMMSVIVLLSQLKKAASFRFRMQIILMTAGILTPIIANYYYVNGLSPHGIDLGPVSMSISFLFHGAALVSYQMFNVTPIARDTVFEKMKNGVIVLNQNGMIVDYNDAMLAIIPALNSQSIGKSIVDAVGKTGPLAEIFMLERECDYEICRDEERVYFQIQFSTVTNKNNYEIGKIITFVDVTEKVDLQKKLKTLASIDGLSQVYNRTFFMQESERVIGSLNGRDVSIIMFDIDHFKKINDTFGHEAGDKVLTHIASTAKESLRTNDIMGRYGGEEFIICLPDTSLTEAYELAQSIRVRISQHSTTYYNDEIYVTSSFGISSALIRKEDSHNTLEVLIREADQALYESKSKGRNYVAIYEDI